MKKIQIRVYEELNDYLPEERKKRTFAVRCTDETAIAEILKSAGIRLEDVDLILLDGEPAGAEQIPSDGSRVSVYPVFESIDIGKVTRVRKEPLRNPRFLADPGLEALTELLRRLGFDTRTGSGLTPGEVDACAEQEGRILLTREPKRLLRVSRVCVVHQSSAVRQLREVIDRLDLRRLIRNRHEKT